MPKSSAKSLTYTSRMPIKLMDALKRERRDTGVPVTKIVARVLGEYFKRGKRHV